MSTAKRVTVIASVIAGCAFIVACGSNPTPQATGSGEPAEGAELHGIMVDEAPSGE